MIGKELAQRFIERVSGHTAYNINIMDENGIIIASRDSERVGQYHEIAHRLIIGTEDMADTTGMNFPNVLPGINMVIEVDHVKEGVVGVTGEPDEIRPVALIIKMALETMLKYERQQEKERLRANKKEHFVYMLTQVENSDPEELRSLARELNYPEEMVRIPLLICAKEDSASRLLAAARESRLHSRRDFSIALDPAHLIIFKYVPDQKKTWFAEYKEFIRDYLSTVLASSQSEGAAARCYVGSFQDTYPQYYYGYRHCKWLESTDRSEENITWFYDHVGEYLRDCIPRGEMQHAFHVYLRRIPPEKLKMFLNTAQALLDTNFHFAEAAAQLYLHKNTLVYRYNTIKAYFNINPINSKRDRDFLAMFCAYCRKNGSKLIR